MAKRSITVNHDQIRRLACRQYNSVVTCLNQSSSYEGYLLVDPVKLAGALDGLRLQLGLIASFQGQVSLSDVYDVDLARLETSDEDE